MKLKLETWHSNNNQEERHYFIPKEGSGYQCNQYVFGYNPKILKQATIKKIMALIKEAYGNDTPKKTGKGDH